MFFPKYLKITDWKSRFLKDRAQFLRDIVKSFLINIPFQNITSFGSIKPELRQMPDMKWMMAACLKGSGGLCGHHNYFLRMSLATLGYETITISGMFKRTGIPQSHCMTLVRIPPPLSKDKKTMDTYFVDVGCGIPIHEPILLSELPYKGRACGLNFQYERTKENQISRINFCGDFLLGEKKPDFISPINYDISLKERNYFDFVPAFTETYLNVQGIYLHGGLYAFRYLNIDDNDFKFVCLKGTDMIIGTKETKTVESYSSYSDMKPLIDKYFPQINSIEVDLALENFSKPLPTKETEAFIKFKENKAKFKALSNS